METKSEPSVIEKFICPICMRQYDIKIDAIICMNSNETPEFEVGEVVELKYGYSWFDGDRNWVINPDVDMSRHGFSKNESIGFYYVITAIENVEHKVRYYVATNAMTGKKGHRGGWTTKNHYYPKKIEAPQQVIEESKKLIGIKLDYLL